LLEEAAGSDELVVQRLLNKLTTSVYIETSKPTSLNFYLMA